MTSMLKAGLAAVVVIAAAQASADVAHARKAHHGKNHKEHARTARFADTTDIRDCAKVAAAKRDQCISRSRPISGAAIYGKHKSVKERAAASVARIGTAVAAVAAGAKLAIARDGTTDIRSCAKVAAAHRDQCISRSRPVKGEALAGAAKPVQTVNAAAAKAKDAAKAAGAATLKTLKGIVAKDGTTDIKDCARVDGSLRDRCISASRPVKGAGMLPGIAKAAANDAGLEAAAKSAAVRAVTAIRNVFAKDGTTDIRDCRKVDPDARDRCISASRPVAGDKLMQRS